MYYAFIHIYKFFPTGVIIKIVFIKSSLSFHCKPKKTKGCTGWGLPVSPWFTVTDSKGVKRLKKWTVTTKFLTQTSRYSKWYKITASSKATQILLRMGTILAGGGTGFRLSIINSDQSYVSGALLQRIESFMEKEDLLTNL